MNIICAKEDLIKGMNIALRAVPSRTTMEVLKCVVLNGENNNLKITANDTSLGIETNVEAEVLESGVIAIDANLFSSIVRKLPNNDISIISDESNKVTIKCENAVFTIPGRGTDDFIYLPSVNSENYIEMTQFTLKDMISKVIFSIAESEVNASMSGVYIEVLVDKIRFTTLDGYRVSLRLSDLKENYNRFSSIVPGKTLSDISKIITDDMDKNIKLLFSKNHVVFEFDKTKVVSRVIEGEYYNINSILQNEYKTKVVMNRKMLLECMDRSTLLVNENDKKPVIITISDEKMNLKLNSAIGTMDEILPVEKKGEDIKIAFNPKLIIDALRAIEDEEISIYLVKYNYPCTIKDDEGSYSYVILPVNFTEE